MIEHERERLVCNWLMCDQMYSQLFYVQVTEVPEGKDKARCGGSKKCKTAVGNVTTTLFVHCTKEIHLTIH